MTSPTVLVLSAAVIACMVCPLEGQSPLPARHPLAAAATATIDRLPGGFTENRARFGAGVKFTARRKGFTAYFTGDAFVLDLRPAASDTAAAIFLTFEGVAPETTVGGEDELPGRVHHLVGNDPAQWERDLRTFSRIRYRGLYPGIDVVVRESEGQIEYDLLLAPDADPSRVVIRCDGAEGLDSAPDGSLVIRTGAGPLTQACPATWELDGGNRHPVPCRYRRIDGTRFGFTVEGRDLSRALLIDPPVVFSTYIGGSACDQAYGIATDGSGAVYVTGFTQSGNFPVTPGAYRTTRVADDAVVLKLNAAGTALVYSTFFGGSIDDYGRAIAVDAQGTAFVTGWTSSENLPVTTGAFRPAYGGGSSDAFLLRLNAQGSGVLYVSYLGGGNVDEGYGVGVDFLGRAYVAGTTQSAGFYTSPAAIQTQLRGGRDGFVTRIVPQAGAIPSYSTFLGGDNEDDVYALHVDGAAGEAYVTGLTASADFPTTPGAAQTVRGGSDDAFVVKLNAVGNSLAYATFFGGSGDEEGWGISADPQGRAVITGITQSSDMPVTPGAFQGSKHSGDDAFVARFSFSGSSRIYSTYLGGNDTDRGYAVACDTDGNAYLTGTTGSSNFPRTTDAFDNVFVPDEAYLVCLPPSGAPARYGTFLGGTNNDRGRAVCADPTGRVFVSGYALAGYPTVNPGFSGAFNGGSGDFFVTAFQFCAGHVASVVNLPACGLALDPVLSMNPPMIGQVVHLQVASAFPAALGWIFLSLGAPPPIPIPGSGCTIWVDVFNQANFHLLAHFITDPQGGFGVDVPLPYDPALLGLGFTLQARICPPLGPPGPLFPDWISNGLYATVGCP